jgi:hypothetical protein
MKVKAIIASILMFTACASASAQRVSNPASQGTYHRFWRGIPRTDIEEQSFLAVLNGRFIPQTVEVGRGRGLLAYQPLLVPKGHEWEAIPGEIALVTYESEKAYRAIRATPEGDAYARAHWDIFKREGSSSVVPVPFEGKVEAGKAYDLHPEFRDWQLGRTVVRIVLRPDLEQVRSYLEELRKNPADVAESIVLVEAGYLIEYRSLNGSGNPNGANLGQEWSVELESAVPSALPIHWGEGINTRFPLRSPL